jgi:Chaperone of endosialidase
MKRTLLSFAIVTLAVIGLALCPKAQAVNPPPDGGYPGFNTAEGDNALLNLSTGVANTAIGWLSLEDNQGGSYNTAIGAGTLLANGGDQNTATGVGALLSNTDGAFNTANGAFALFLNTTGLNNTAIGWYSLFNNTADQNTAVGGSALLENVSGSSNTAVGQSALVHSTGSGNTALGFIAGNGVTTANNVICIGNGVAGADVSDTCFIGNIRDVTTQNGDAIAVVIDSAGQLGTMSSSQRFKKEVQPIDKASEAILALKPVTFQYKTDKTNAPQFGLIAEDVAKVNPDLVVRDKDGEIYTVRYEAVNAMLLNEFLKEHRRVEELKSEMAQQRKEFGAAIAQERRATEAVLARLNEQEARIQKVSAQIEARKPRPQMLVQNQ